LSDNVTSDFGEFDDVASDFGELGVAENVGVAVGISSIPHPVSDMQSTSG